jgi:hypothetical protein
MLLQAPTTWLNALLNAISAGTLPTPQQLPGAGTNYIGLHLVPALGTYPAMTGPATDPGEYPGGTTAIAALISAAGRSIAVPALWQPSWLSIPSRWVAAISPGVVVPQSGPLLLSADCGADIQGAWAAAFQALGFTAYTPVASGPWPIVAG